MHTIVGIFAHPDDEAFGPGGTLAEFSKENDVFVICVTDGDAAQKDKNAQKKMGMVRRKELQESIKILGVKKVFFMGYHDGSLCHNLYHEIAEKLKKQLEKLKPQTVITFEPRGVSGHIDHIVVSMVVSFLFPKLPFIKTLLYYCIDESFRELIKDYFIHVPMGYKKSEIHKTVQTAHVWETKIRAMNKHQSQIHDLKKVLTWQLQAQKQEYFLVVEKK